MSRASGIRHPAATAHSRVTQSTAPLSIAGYAALFDREDRAGDIILPGAFARSLAEAADPFPLLWEHRPEKRIGTVGWLGEDNRGLRIIARLDSSRSRAAHALYDRTVTGLSFGYRARAFQPLPGGRLLEDIELIEVSLVTYPLQNGARVHLVH
ncbi:HK97 family phage prohead protease [Altericroceibacterium spongiae]|uniref:HK97 family phage prohead protease n=1 Tax=Altericroceibacterium spongiae TaxID=2320269 RepID=A0A420EIW0_9SPHN|nr:HK97 family phage prohead protease [Altericroceibacterium spongiae]RKF20583.1 HK97 family phage prohead protease [Altericroceibacterium spongiae]